MTTGGGKRTTVTSWAAATAANMARLDSMAGPHGIDDAIRGAASPSWSDGVRAKREILTLLADGEPHGIGSIQRVLHPIDDVPSHLGDRPKIEVPSGDDVERIVTSSHPIIAHYRLAWAATNDLGPAASTVPRRSHARKHRARRSRCSAINRPRCGP